MDGRRHLAIGATVGVVSTGVSIATFNYVKPEHISYLNTVVIAIILSSLLGLILPDKIVEKVPMKVIPANIMLTCILSLGFILISFSDMGTVLIYCVFGAVLGSLIPDLDSSRSTINKHANRIILTVIFLYLVGLIIKLPILSQFVEDKSLGFVIAFAVLCVLGKMSPHREFTHKILGFIVFSFCMYFISPFLIWITFMLGFLSHVIADKTTPAGRKYHPFDLKLPCQKADGKFDLSDSMKHLYKSSKVH